MPWPYFNILIHSTMKLALYVFIALSVYLLNEYRLIRKYIRAIEKTDKKIK